MFKILIPIDGSENAKRALGYVIKISTYCPNLQIDLLNVQAPLPGDVGMFMTEADIRLFHEENANQVFMPACAILDAAKLDYSVYKKIGNIAGTIILHIKEDRYDNIVMGSHGTGTLRGLFLGSVAAKVVHLSDVPVTLVK